MRLSPMGSSAENKQTTHNLCSTQQEPKSYSFCVLQTERRTRLSYGWVSGILCSGDMNFRGELARVSPGNDADRWCRRTGCNLFLGSRPKLLHITFLLFALAKGPADRKYAVISSLGSYWNMPQSTEIKDLVNWISSWWLWHQQDPRTTENNGQRAFP